LAGGGPDEILAELLKVGEGTMTIAMCKIITDVDDWEMAC